MARLLTLERNEAPQMGIDIIPYNCGGTIAFPQTPVDNAACAIATEISNDLAYSGYGISYSMVQSTLTLYLQNVNKNFSPWNESNSAVSTTNYLANQLHYTADQVYAIMWYLYQNAQNSTNYPNAYAILNGTPQSKPSGITNALSGLWDGIQNMLKNLGTVGTILPWAALGLGAVWLYSYLPKPKKEG